MVLRVVEPLSLDVVLRLGPTLEASSTETIWRASGAAPYGIEEMS